MNNDFWINISKTGMFYVVEEWIAGEDRILYVQKRKTITKIGARRYAKRCIIRHISSQYIKEKI